MKPGLLERIREAGHWRVVMRPLVPRSDALSFRQCLDEIEKSKVSMRGWDYPHVSSREDDTGGLDRDEKSVGSWCDWRYAVEFWRLFRSGQFITYITLQEDLSPDLFNVAAKGFINTQNTIYSIVEFVEFGSRLAKNGLYADGFSVDITLNNAAGRYLVAGMYRMPFLERRVTGASSINLKRDLRPEELNQEKEEIIVKMAAEFFDYFGWNPNMQQIKSDVERFYRREF